MTFATSQELERKLALVEQGAGLMARIVRSEITPMSDTTQNASSSWADFCKSLRDDYYDEVASQIQSE